jgi:predicted unusual protein kinase regulating ubiquinone biosynthesis (AarF/ABC1/UbiB family)
MGRSPPADDDALTMLLSRLAETPARVPTGALARLGRTARVGIRAATQAVMARGRGGAAGIGSLSPEALSELVVSLGELKGVAMKMGQILSYLDLSLVPEARRLLSVLQVQSQATPIAEIEQTIRDDLGAEAPELVACLERDPVASASIGQVYRATLPDGSRVAVKVRHPGIAEAIQADFRSAALGRVLGSLVYPGGEVQEVIDEARERFSEECDYALEARRQARFAELYAEDPDITVPRVRFAWCGPRVLTTDWHEGVGLDAFVADAPPEVRDRAGRALYRFYVGTLYTHGLFNADPHPGNLLFAPDGAVTILDHGCVREFDRETVRALVRLSRAVRRDDNQATLAALSDIGMPRPSRGFDVTRTLLRGFYAPLLASGPHRIEADRAIEAQAVLRSKRALLRMRLPGRLLFLFRIRFGLHAVLARLGAEADWAALEEELAKGI